MYINHPVFRCRQRAQAIMFMLSARGFTVPQLWAIFDVRCDAISDWIDHWERKGLVGLYDLPRTGRLSIYTDTEVGMLKTLVDEEPRQIKTVQVKLAGMTQKEASTSTLKRLLKKMPLPLEKVGVIQKLSLPPLMRLPPNMRRNMHSPRYLVL